MDGLRNGNTVDKKAIIDVPMDTAHCCQDNWGIFSIQNHVSILNRCMTIISNTCIVIAMSDAGDTRQFIYPLMIR